MNYTPDYSGVGQMLAEARKKRVSQYDARVLPIIEELLSFGYGATAMANVLNERHIYSPHGKPQTAATVKLILQRLGLL